MKRYDDQTRRQARELYEQGGTFQAARGTGVSARTIREWAQQGGWRASAASEADQAARVAAMRQGWERRRRGLADQAGEAAHDALNRLQERLHAGRIAGIRDLAHTFALCVDRAEALSARTGGELEQAPPGVRLDRINAMLTDLLPRLEERRSQVQGNGDAG